MVFYAAFNSLSVISQRQLRLFMLSWVSPVLGWALKCLAQGHSYEKTQRIQCGSNPGPLHYKSTTLPLSHVGPRELPGRTFWKKNVGNSVLYTFWYKLLAFWIPVQYCCLQVSIEFSRISSSIFLFSHHIFSRNISRSRLKSGLCGTESLLPEVKLLQATSNIFVSNTREEYFVVKSGLPTENSGK